MAVDIAAVLTASITDFKAKMADAEVSMKTMTSSGSGAFSKLQSVGKGALLGVGAVVAVVGAAAIDFGNKLEMSQAQLQAALQASGISWSSVSASVAATGQSAAKYGFTQAQIDAALQQGVISTQNYASAHRNLTIAIQLAAARHIDLSTAMQAVDKAATGQLRPLKMLGIDLPVVASNALKVQQAHDKLAASQLKVLALLQQYPGAISATSKQHAAYQKAVDAVAVATDHLSQVSNAHNVILNALSQRLGGQASAAAKTFEGRIAAAKAQATNLVAELGMKLIPVLVQVMDVIMRVVNWFQNHKAAAEALGIAIGVLVAGPIAAYIAGMAAAAVETVIATAPVLAIILAAAALGAGIFYLATHWQQVWSDIKKWTDDAYQWIQQRWYLLMGIPLVGWILALAVNWRTVWSVIQTAVSGAWSIIQPIFNLIKTAGTDYIEANIAIMQTAWNVAWTAVTTVVSGVWAVIGPVFGFIKTLGIDVITTAINGLLSVWNGAWGAISGAVQTAWSIIQPIVSAIETAASAVSSAISFITGSSSVATANSGKAPGVGGTPVRAGGGPVSALQPYIVGENGPEYFIPSASGTIVPNGAGFGGTPVSGGPGGGTGGPAVFNLHINGQQFATAVFPDFWTVMLQQKRSVMNLNLA